jgi:AraC family transcriptional regulator
MSSSTARSYEDRFRDVLEYIESHLDETLSVERLSQVAAFSKHHFHRQWVALLGLGVLEYVKLVRFKRASFQLAFHDDLRVLDIALASGYESHEAFTRAFKKLVGQTPLAFRTDPDWDHWHATWERLRAVRIAHLRPRSEPVTIVELTPTQVAVLEHRGDARRLGESLRRFIEWRRAHALPPSVSATYNIVYDDLDSVPPEDFRFDLCAAITAPLGDDRGPVVAKTIPGGRRAKLRHIGSDDTLRDAVEHLYSSWLPASGEEPDDVPLYFQRVVFFPGVPEHQAITDVFVPLRPGS